MALSQSQFSDAGGAVSDLFGGISDIFSGDSKAEGLRLKAQGDLAEASNYDLASTLATQNEAYTKESTAIQQAQQERNTYLQIGNQKAQIAGAGFAESGSALDILRDSASQGALAKAVLGQQGLITEAGYQEQAQSYTTMANTARSTAAEEENMANDAEHAGMMGAIGKGIGAAINIGAAIVTGGASLPFTAAATAGLGAAP
jgi:hypothetical protein